jgi:hypothetical protein
MATAAPNAQRRYFPQSVNSPSTTNLLPPSATRGSGGGVQANFAKGPPSLRTMASNSSLVRDQSVLLLPVLILASQNESPYNVSATAGSRIPPLIPSISDKASVQSSLFEFLVHITQPTSLCLSCTVNATHSTSGYSYFIFPHAHLHDR